MRLRAGEERAEQQAPARHPRVAQRTPERPQTGAGLLGPAALGRSDDREGPALKATRILTHAHAAHTISGDLQLP